MTRRKLQWIAAALVPIWIAIHFSSSLTGSKQQALMPGPASHGHHQIELQCSVCHTENMGVKHDACASCHQEELDRVSDSHPVSKFLDPRNADRLALLDARQCTTCHVEHQLDRTDGMGVTLPSDYCFFCHQDIEEDRPTHKGLGFDTCATAGCHNFHDNTALYEDFLEKHFDEAPLSENPSVPQRSYYQDWAEKNDRSPLAAADQNAPAQIAVSENTLAEWAASAHANSGVNCTDCHSGESGSDWVQSPALDSCQSCHSFEAETFLQSRHGMRLAQDLSPMTPAMARIPMHQDAAHASLTCSACHDDHSYDTKFAAVDACLKCHADDHSVAYTDSKHHQLWINEISGNAPAGTGVSCATCHFPRIEVTEFGEEKVKVLHNQNDTLRPNEKMIRPVCIQCHGLGFSLDAQADSLLIERNYQGLPSHHVESLEMVKEKLRSLSSQH